MSPETKGKIFMTGAGGYIGSVIAEFAIAQGYEVTGLSRSEKSDEKMEQLGVVPVRGDLHSLDVLSRESAKADVVINLADPMLQNLTDYEAVVRIDAAAVGAMAEPLKGTSKRLIVTSGTAVVNPANGAETDESSPLHTKPLNDRIRCEQNALALAKEGVHVIAIRLAPYVYGRGGSGVRLFMQRDAAMGQILCFDGGKNPTSVVHVDDAARLYLLAAEKGQPGDILNATSSTEVTAGQLAEAEAKAVALPVRHMTHDEGVAMFEQQMKLPKFLAEFMVKFRTLENRASNAKAVKELGWQPKEMGILEEIEKGSYQAVAAEIKKART